MKTNIILILCISMLLCANLNSQVEVDIQDLGVPENFHAPIANLDRTVLIDDVPTYIWSYGCTPTAIPGRQRIPKFLKSDNKFI